MLQNNRAGHVLTDCWVRNTFQRVCVRIILSVLMRVRHNKAQVFGAMKWKWAKCKHGLHGRAVSQLRGINCPTFPKHSLRVSAKRLVLTTTTFLECQHLHLHAVWGGGGGGGAATQRAQLTGFVKLEGVWEWTRLLALPLTLRWFPQKRGSKSRSRYEAKMSLSSRRCPSKKQTAPFLLPASHP